MPPNRDISDEVRICELGRVDGFDLTENPPLPECRIITVTEDTPDSYYNSILSIITTQNSQSPRYNQPQQLLLPSHIANALASIRTPNPEPTYALDYDRSPVTFISDNSNYNEMKMTSDEYGEDLRRQEKNNSKFKNKLNENELNLNLDQKDVI